MRAGHDFDDRSDAVALDSSHDARKPIARRLGDYRPIHSRASALVHESRHFRDRYDPLPPGRALHPDGSVLAPSSDGLDGNAEHFGRLTDSKARTSAGSAFVHTKEL